ncbi:MAG: hypothetical protein M3P50_14065 [Actinomycetota bacterium]|nr:hypothetical protein [Actinomycetota bacterium]
MRRRRGGQRCHRRCPRRRRDPGRVGRRRHPGRPGARPHRLRARSRRRAARSRGPDPRLRAGPAAALTRRPRPRLRRPGEEGVDVRPRRRDVTHPPGSTPRVTRCRSGRREVTRGAETHGVSPQAGAGRYWGDGRPLASGPRLDGWTVTELQAGTRKPATRR